MPHTVVPRRWPWSRAPEPPDAGSFAPASILLASEGRRIPAEAVEFAANLSRKSKAAVHVFMIARVWGSSFGLPHPGLMPTKREWQQQRDLVAEAVRLLQQRGFTNVYNLEGGIDAWSDLIDPSVPRY
ncbi:MAG: hypothetical protein WAM55_04495 [Methylovirgula sp.]